MRWASVKVGGERGARGAGGLLALSEVLGEFGLVGEGTSGTPAVHR